MKKAIDIFFLLAFFYITVRSAPPTVAVYRDSGELAAAGITYGIAHPPGYPLYVNLSRIFHFVHIGNPAYFQNVISALYFVLMCFIVKKMLFSDCVIPVEAGNYNFPIPLLAKRGGSAQSGAEPGYFNRFRIKCGMTEAGGLSDNITGNLLIYSIFISAGIIFRLGRITEMYSLNNFLTVLFIYFLFRAEKLNSLHIAAFLSGVAFANQQISILVILPAIIYLFLKSGEWRRLRPAALICCLLFALGLSLYLYLPLRAVNRPLVNWGDPSTFGSFIKHFTRADYGKTKLHPSKSAGVKGIGSVIESQKTLFKYLVREMRLPLLLILLSLPLLKSPRNIFFIISFVLSGCIMAVFVSMDYDPFSISMSDTIYGYALLFLVLLIISGFVESGRILKYISLFIVIPTAFFVYDRSFSRNEFLGYDYPKQLLMSLSRNSTLFLKGDDDVFPVDYLYNAEGYRNDLKIYDYFANVFPNIYGQDYRTRNKSEREKIRNERINRIIREEKNVFFSSMERSNTFEGNPLEPELLYFRIKKGDKGGFSSEFYNQFIVRYDRLFIPDEYRRNQLLANMFYVRGILGRDYGDEKFMKYLFLACSSGREADWLSVNLSSLFFEAGEKEKAAAYLSSTIKLYPSRTDLRYNLGAIYARSGEYKKAGEQFIRLYEMSGELKAIDGIRRIGMDLYLAKKYNESVRYFSEVLKYFPDDIEAIRNLALIHHGYTGEREMARFYLKRYFSLTEDEDIRKQIQSMLSSLK